MFERVLIAVDGSAHSERALQVAGELAELAGAEARVVHVREILLFPRSGEVSDEDRVEAAEVLERAAEKLRAAGVKVTTVLRTSVNGQVCREILDEADSWHATLLVLASRGLSDIAGIVIGSTAHKLLHLSHLPILVVR